MKYNIAINVIWKKTNGVTEIRIQDRSTTVRIL